MALLVWYRASPSSVKRMCYPECHTPHQSLGCWAAHTRAAWTPVQSPHLSFATGTAPWESMSIGLVGLWKSNPRPPERGGRDTEWERKPQSRKLGVSKTNATSQYVWECTPLPVTTATSHPIHTLTSTLQPNQRIPRDCFKQIWSEILRPPACFNFRASYFTLVLVLLKAERGSGTAPHGMRQQSGCEVKSSTSVPGFVPWPITY